MRVEWYAAVVALVGVALWLRGSVLGSTIALLFFSLFGGGAAFIVGGASIIPASFALVFLLAHVLLSMFSKSDHVNLGLKTNTWLGLFCFFGVLSAYIFPKIFVNLLSLPPLAASAHPVAFAAVPLHYSKQNITTAIYMIGAFVASVCAGAASADPESRQALVRWAVVIAWIHIFFGLAGSMLQNIGGGAIIRIFRNATYAELVETEAGGYSRIAGIFPEPSAYAGYAFGWLAFMTELWLRDVLPTLTMITAGALTLMLIACTSTSGYAALALYVLLLALRFFVAPRSLKVAKVIPVAMVMLTLATAALATFAFVPHLGVTVGRALARLTVGKAETLSGQERLFWARSGINAFIKTWGVGVGAGSFRSSSLLLAILGSTGVIGTVLFFIHVFNILKPFRVETYALPGEADNAIAVAAAWAACAGLIPAMLSASTPVPSYVFSVMGGLALGWRYSMLSGQVAQSADPVIRRGYVARAGRVI
jgi:hypothetical protein